MKRCPECNRTFTDETLRFCLYDGKALTGDASPPIAPPPIAASSPPAVPPPNQPYTAPPTYSAPPYAAPPTYGYQPYAAPPRRKSPWGWIIGGVVIVFLLLRVGMHTAPQSRRATGPETERSATMPETGPQPDAKTQPETRQPDAPPSDSSLRDTLIAAIRLADDAEAQSFRQLDPAPLYPAYTGPALERELASLKALKDGGVSVDSKMLNQDFGEFKVTSDQSTAQVDVTETWSLTTYSAETHQPVRTNPSNVVPQTVFLKRNDTGWIVEKIQPRNP